MDKFTNKIDDKMINKANEESTTVKEIGDKYICEYYKDADGLNIKRATINPRATEYISEIKEISHPYTKGISPREGIEF